MKKINSNLSEFPSKYLAALKNIGNPSNLQYFDVIFNDLITLLMASVGWVLLDDMYRVDIAPASKSIFLWQLLLSIFLYWW